MTESAQTVEGASTGLDTSQQSTVTTEDLRATPVFVSSLDGPLTQEQRLMDNAKHCDRADLTKNEANHKIDYHSESNRSHCEVDAHSLNLKVHAKDVGD